MTILLFQLAGNGETMISPSFAWLRLINLLAARKINLAQSTTHPAFRTSVTAERIADSRFSASR